MGKNRVCELLGIKYPIIQGITTASIELAAAVSNAGGLGTITAQGDDPEVIRERVRKIKTLTDKPFTLNVPIAYYGEASVDRIRIGLEEGCTIFTTSSGNPDITTPFVKRHGAKVMHIVPSVRHALKAEQAGVDAIIASGTEAGGIQSREQTTTLVLIPQVVDAVKLPVIAAGGFADARGLIAALALGAEAIQMGTRFLAVHENAIDDGWRRLVLDANDTVTTLGERGGNPSRFFKREYVESKGLDANRFYLSGQIAGMIKEVCSAADVIQSIVSQTDAVRKRIGDVLP